MVTTTVPLVKTEQRIRTFVTPAAFDCQAPAEVAEVTAVPPARGVEEMAYHVVPPSPDASNCTVAENVPLTLNTTPPTFELVGMDTQLVAWQAAFAAVRLPEACCAFTGNAKNRSKNTPMNHSFFTLITSLMPLSASES
jgi:hypothetical protein